MKFTKMHGCGNDYIYVNGFTEHIDDPGAVSKLLSDRRFGIGGDGLIMINPSKTADFEMAMYNADGSRGKMCGNGIRCVAKYVYDRGLTDKTEISVETLGGIKYLQLTVKDGRVQSVRVDMGAPEFACEKIPVTADTKTAVDVPIEVNGVSYRMTCVSMGNPHAVVYVDDVDGFDLEHIGPRFEHHERFPDRVNTEFIRVPDRKHIQMRVWERGSGETWACGTGACAAAVASIVNGLADKDVTVHLRGGDLQISWDPVTPGASVFMTGPATTVFDGEI